jgi:hypothetical protein
MNRSFRWLLSAAALLLCTTACVPNTVAAKDPPPANWNAVYFNFLAIDLDRNPIVLLPIDITANVAANAPTHYYDSDTGRLRDYPVSVSKKLPYTLPFWYDPSAHGSILTTVYYDSSPGDTIICYVANKNGVEIPQTRSEKRNDTAGPIQLQNPCFYNF